MENKNTKKRENYFYVTKITTNPDGRITKEKIYDIRFGNRKKARDLANTMNKDPKNKKSGISYEV